MSLIKAERTTTINYMEVGTYLEGGVCFKIPKKLVSVRNPRKARKPMSEEQRAAARDRLASVRATKNSGQGQSGTRPDTSE